MTVTCSDLPFRSLLYEVQHRSTFDSEWQVSGELPPTRGQGAGGSPGRTETGPAAPSPAVGTRSCGCLEWPVPGQQAGRSGTALRRVLGPGCLSPGVLRSRFTRLRLMRRGPPT